MGDDSINQYTAHTEQCKAAEVPEYIGAEFIFEKMLDECECPILDLCMDPDGRMLLIKQPPS